MRFEQFGATPEGHVLIDGFYALIAIDQATKDLKLLSKPELAEGAK